MTEAELSPQYDSGEDRRSEDREDVDLPGRVILNEKCSYACHIRNTSPGGVLIHLNKRHYVPPRFDLQFAETGAILPCRRAWQTSGKIGAQYLSRLLKDVS